MKRESYIPKGLLVLDVSVQWDVNHHYNYIFKELSKLPFDNYHNELYIKVTGMDIGHFPYKNVQSLLDLLYSIRHSRKINESVGLKNFVFKGGNNKLKDKLRKYNRGRVDIVNRGNKDNSVQILDYSDNLALIKFPKWLNTESGTGCVIHSENNFMDIKFKCIGDGDLTIYLRGVDAHDTNGNRIPIYLYYSNFILNDEVIFKEDKLAWHNKPFEKSLSVKDGEIVKIHIEWVPF